MIKKQEIMNLQSAELAQEILRFRSGKMKLGVNKKSPSVGIGCVVMLQQKPHDRPEIGVVTELHHGDCRVRLRNRSLATTLAVLTPITLNSEQGTKVMGVITHFISMELEGEGAKEKIAELQVQLQSIPGIGKPMKIPNLHLMLAVLSVKPNELSEVSQKTIKAIERFKDVMSSSDGFLLTCNLVKFLDTGSLALGIDVGKELCVMARHLIEEELGQLLTDLRFSPHLTLFTNNKMGQLERNQLGESLSHVKTGSFSCNNITLRTKKTDDSPSIEVLACTLGTD
jgi:2'-5' RNA ligase